MYRTKQPITIHKNKFYKGSTFIELLLYIGIVSVVLLASSSIAMNVLYGKAKISAIEEVSQNGRFALEKISGTIRNADEIGTPVLGEVSSTLSLTMPDSAFDPTVFDLDGGRLWMKKGSMPKKALTGNGVVVEDIQFSNVSYVDTSGTIRIKVEIASRNPNNRKEFEVQQIFYTTVNVKRNNEN